MPIKLGQGDILESSYGRSELSLCMSIVYSEGWCTHYCRDWINSSSMPHLCDVVQHHQATLPTTAHTDIDTDTHQYAIYTHHHTTALPSLHIYTSPSPHPLPFLGRCGVPICRPISSNSAHTSPLTPSPSLPPSPNDRSVAGSRGGGGWSAVCRVDSRRPRLCQSFHIIIVRWGGCQSFPIIIVRWPIIPHHHTQMASHSPSS